MAAHPDDVLPVTDGHRILPSALPGSIRATKISPIDSRRASPISNRSSSRMSFSSAIPPSSRQMFPLDFNARRASTGPGSSGRASLIKTSSRPSPSVHRQRSCSRTCIAWLIHGPLVKTLGPRSVRLITASSIRIPAANNVSLVPDNAAPIPLTLRLPSNAPTYPLKSSAPASESRASTGSPAQYLATSRSSIPLNALPRPSFGRTAPRARPSRKRDDRYRVRPQHRLSSGASPTETATRIAAIILNAA